MTSQNGKKRVKNEELKLQCEWNNCRQIYNDLSDYYSHLNDHFLTDCGSNSLQDDDDALSCQWNECIFIASCHNDLLRHLYFHGYHTKVKWWGLLCCQRQKLSECRSLHNRNIIPELPEGFRCEWKDCYLLFDIPDQFYMHVYNHAMLTEYERVNPTLMEFVCQWEGCNYSYSTNNPVKAKLGHYKLREHLRTHTKERTYACPWCGNLYVNRTKFTDHLHRQMCIESHCFQCTHCSRTFATERLLKDHMRHHVNYYKCPKCPMTCPNPSGLKHHMKYKHSDERPYQCHFCDYRSKTPYDLQVHMTFHQSDLSYRCHVKDCEYSARSLQNLRYHFRSKHMVGKAKCYACHVCTKTYGVGCQLTNHLRAVHGFQWPPGHSRFKYKECDDGFFRLQTFRFESVELTEELMIDDQASNSSSRSDASVNESGQIVVQAKSPGTKKRKTTKSQPTLSVTTRSAAQILKKAQTQKHNSRNNRTRRGPKRMMKKLKNTKNLPASSTSVEDSSKVEPSPPDSALRDVPNTYHERISQNNSLSNWVDIAQSSSSNEDILQKEFGGRGLTRTEETSLSTELKVADSPEQFQCSSSLIANEDENPTPVLTFTEHLSSSQQSRLASQPDGSLVYDDQGGIRTLVIDGEKFYLVKGTNQENLITYSLISVSNYSQLLNATS